MEKITELAGREIAGRLQELNWSVRTYGVLRASVELGIYAAIAAGHDTVGKLATVCRAKPDLLEKLLIACVAEGWLVKLGERYRNSQVATICLLPDAPMYQGDSIIHGGNTADYFVKLADHIRLEGDEREENWHHHFIWAMHDIAICGPAQAIARNVDFTGCTRLLDVGGGPGTYSIAICEVWPQVHATIFDLPQTLAHAGANVLRYGMAERIGLHEGDWDRDDFGSGYDAVLMSNVLHGEESDAEDKLGKALRCMAAGGVLVVHDFFLTEYRDGPPMAAGFNLWRGAYDGAQFRRIVERVGFEALGFTAGFELGRGVFIARKPR